jgi:hypothetical protein
MRWGLVVLVLAGTIGCAPGDPKYIVRDDATLQCLSARGLTSDWELSRGYHASVGLSPSHVPNQVTSVRLAYASAHCMIDEAERERLLGILRSNGYADPT